MGECINFDLNKAVLKENVSKLRKLQNQLFRFVQKIKASKYSISLIHHTPVYSVTRVLQTEMDLSK